MSIARTSIQIETSVYDRVIISDKINLAIYLRGIDESTV